MGLSQTRNTGVNGARMKAAVLGSAGRAVGRPLRMQEVAKPEAGAGQVLLRVLACGVCRTDLHIVDGELAPRRENLIPGHQIVGEIVEGATPELPLGTRVGVSWIGGTDGSCWYCRHGHENLCDSPTFTGYSVNGGYAEYAVARADFVFLCLAALDALHAAPLLCAGIIGFRSLRVAGVERGEELDCSALELPRIWPSTVLQAWGCEVYVSTRGESHRKLAESLGARWVGSETGKASGGVGSRSHICSQRRGGCCGTFQSAQRRRGGDQCDPPRPNA